jgi:hypothetical protein
VTASPATLRDLVVSVRSKNAGPFSVTFDLFFPDTEGFEKAVADQIITPDRVADLYGLRPEQVKVFNFRPSLAIKVSIPRLVPGGAPGDSDVAGGQQFAPLLSLSV